MISDDIPTLVKEADAAYERMLSIFQQYQDAVVELETAITNLKEAVKNQKP